MFSGVHKNTYSTCKQYYNALLRITSVHFKSAVKSMLHPAFRQSVWTYKVTQTIYQTQLLRDPSYRMPKHYLHTFNTRPPTSHLPIPCHRTCSPPPMYLDEWKVSKYTVLRCREVSIEHKQNNPWFKDPTIGISETLDTRTPDGGRTGKGARLKVEILALETGMMFGVLASLVCRYV